jgi:hypothetical protein
MREFHQKPYTFIHALLPPERKKARLKAGFKKKKPHLYVRNEVI